MASGQTPVRSVGSVRWAVGKARTARGAVAWAAVVLALLVAGCSGGAGVSAAPGSAGVPATDGPTGSGHAGGIDRPAPATPDPDPVLGPVDESLVDALRADGLDEDEAVFLALTRVEATRLGPLTQRLVAIFPTGDAVTLTFTFVPGHPGDPSDIEVSHSVVDDGVAFRLAYVVPEGGLPLDLVASLRSAARQRPVAGPLVAEGGSGIGVIVEGVMKQGASTGTKQLLGLLEDRLKNGMELKNLFKALKADLTIRDGILLREEYLAYESRIDALESCARNPTNPLTRKAYREDPALRERLLQQVADTRAEVKANVLVTYLAMMNKLGSGLVDVPWLGYVVGPGTAWSKAALKELNERLIAELDDAITDCSGYQFEFSGSGEGRRLDAPIHTTWRYWGVQCPETKEWLLWEDYQEGQYDWVTGPPGSADGAGPETLVFGPDGALATASWQHLTMPRATLGGTGLRLDDVRKPTRITADILVGSVRRIEDHPVVPYDGSFGGCETEP